MGLTTENPAAAGRRLALIICNSSFGGVRLPGPAKDAQMLDEVFSNPETCRFSVTKLLDARLLHVRREIARVCAEASDADTLLIYYSGNGLTGKDGSLYLITADTDAEYPDATALDAEFILSQLRSSACRKFILIIDSCNAGAFFNNNRGIPNGVYAITSCGADEVCIDTEEGGAFSLAVSAGLRDAAADRDGDGLVSIDELHEYVKQKLKADGYTWTPLKWVWNVPDPIFVTAVPRHVFLSYAREDMQEIDRLAEALKKEGLAVWIDRTGIQAGNWRDRVTEGLNRARALVVLLTPTSLKSDAVRKELGFANSKKVPIIPVQLEEIADSDFPDWFRWDYDELHRHSIAPDQYHEGIKALAAAIFNLRPSNASATSPLPIQQSSRAEQLSKASR